MSPAKKIDVLPGDAGGAATAVASEFIDNLFESGGSEGAPETPETPETAESPAPNEEAAKPEMPGADFEEAAADPKPGASPKPGEPLPVKRDEPIPDHVARKGDKAIETWKRMREELADKEARLADVERDRLLQEQEKEELKKKLETAPPAEEIDKLKQQIADYEDRLGRMDVTQTPHFRDNYEKPLQELFGKVVNRLKTSGREEKDAVALARKAFSAGSDPAALEAVLPDETAVTIGSVSALLEDRDVLVQKRNQALENWRQTNEAAQDDLRRKQSVEISQQLTSYAEQAFDAAVKDGSWLFQRGQDPKWNEGVEARKAAALGYIRAGKPSDIARLVVEGIAAPVYRKGYSNLKARFDALSAQFEAVTKGRPGIAPRTPGSQAPAPAGKEPPRTMEAAVDEIWEE